MAAARERALPLRTERLLDPHAQAEALVLVVVLFLPRRRGARWLSRDEPPAPPSKAPPSRARSRQAPPAGRPSRSAPPTRSVRPFTAFPPRRWTSRREPASTRPLPFFALKRRVASAPTPPIFATRCSGDSSIGSDEQRRRAAPPRTTRWPGHRPSTDPPPTRRARARPHHSCRRRLPTRRASAILLAPLPMLERIYNGCGEHVDIHLTSVR